MSFYFSPTQNTLYRILGGDFMPRLLPRMTENFSTTWACNDSVLPRWQTEHFSLEEAKENSKMFLCGLRLILKRDSFLFYLHSSGKYLKVTLSLLILNLIKKLSISNPTYKPDLIMFRSFQAHKCRGLQSKIVTKKNIDSFLKINKLWPTEMTCSHVYYKHSKTYPILYK